VEVCRVGGKEIRWCEVVAAAEPPRKDIGRLLGSCSRSRSRGGAVGGGGGGLLCARLSVVVRSPPAGRRETTDERSQEDRPHLPPTAPPRLRLRLQLPRSRPISLRGGSAAATTSHHRISFPPTRHTSTRPSRPRAIPTRCHLPRVQEMVRRVPLHPRRGECRGIVGFFDDDLCDTAHNPPGCAPDPARRDLGHSSRCTSHPPGRLLAG